MTTKQRELETIARLWKVGRLLAGKTQVELSLALGISQSSISKYESMALEPSASDWYQFCQYVGIDAHKTLSLGYIDGKKKFKHRLFGDSMLKLPMRYRRDFLLKIRELIPFRKCVRTELGAEAWETFLSEHKIDDDLFFIYDFQVSLCLLQDLIKWCQERSFNLMEKVASYSGDIKLYGVLNEKYSKRKRPQDLIKEIMDDQVYFHRVFSSQIESTSQGLKVSTVINEDALDFFEEKILKNFLSYKIESFKQAIQQNNTTPFDFKVTYTQDELSFLVSA